MRWLYRPTGYGPIAMKPKTRLFLKGFPILVGVLMVAVATAHRAMLDDPEYTSHWLIALEFAMLLLLMALLLVQALYAVVQLFRGQWKKIFLAIGLWILTFVLFYLSIAIDAPTLLYAT
jgi:hypothetical protein